MTQAVTQRRERPTDKQILEALEYVDAQIFDIRRAATVADEYINMEILAGFGGSVSRSKTCVLNSEQAAGILYMANHVRDLAAALEDAADKAYGREARS